MPATWHARRSTNSLRREVLLVQKRDSSEGSPGWQLYSTVRAENLPGFYRNIVAKIDRAMLPRSGSPRQLSLMTPDIVRPTGRRRGPARPTRVADLTERPERPGVSAAPASTSDGGVPCIECTPRANTSTLVYCYQRGPSEAWRITRAILIDAHSQRLLNFS